MPEERVPVGFGSSVFRSAWHKFTMMQSTGRGIISKSGTGYSQAKANIYHSRIEPK
jgi:hypothetical protein